MRAVRWGLLLCVVTGGCQPERLFPDRVGMGVARLTVRNAATLVSLLDSDTRCGFKSPQVLASRVDEGQVGGPGVARWQVSGCTFEFPELHTIARNCNDVETQAVGRVTLDAVKSLRGILTGNPESAVVPDGPDAIAFDVVARFDGYEVRISGKDTALKNTTGELAFTGRPHLAVSASRGVCSISTADFTLEGLRYRNAAVEMESEGRRFPVDVPSSDYSAQAGKWADKENWIGGSIQVWDAKVSIPTAEDTNQLDPDYDAATSVKSISCKEDLLLPPTYDCAPLPERFAEAGARLTVSTFGKLVSMVNEDTRCGFASAGVKSGVRTDGALGKAGGEAIYTLGQPCTLELTEPTTIATDCLGAETVVQGRVTVTGTKSVRGILTGSSTDPVVPVTRDPATLTIQATFDDFTMKRVDLDRGLQILRGTLAGSMSPRTGRDVTTGACSISTPVVSFTDLTYANADLLIHSGASRIGLHVNSSSLDAQSGSGTEHTNWLEGTMVVDGQSIAVPMAASGTVLDPDYAEETFTASYECTPNLELVDNDAACSLNPRLAEGVGRLTVGTFGKLVGLVADDTTCGFMSPRVLETVSVQGAVGERGGMVVYNISEPCTLRFNVPTDVDQDCLGTRTYVSGVAVVTGTKTVRGIITGDPTTPVVPTSRDPAEVRLTALLADFRITDSETRHLTMHQATLTGVAKPRTAQDQLTGACSISTPVVEFQDVRLSDSDVQLFSDGKTFSLHVADANLDAVNGSTDGRTNFLAGTVDIDGQTHTVPLQGNALNPDFNPTSFNASYACIPNMRLAETEAQCSMTRTLAEGAARLLVQTVGTVARRVNLDSDCGFESTFVLINPSEVQGEPGEMGLMSWDISQCELASESDEVLQEDCLGGRYHQRGTAVVDASRTVRGERETKLLFIDSIIPRDRNAVQVTLSNVEAAELSIYYVDPGRSDPRRKLTIHSGTITANIQPVLGERESEHGVFDVSTPISQLSAVTLTDADVTLFSEGKTFHLQIPQATVNAFNGSYSGHSNELEGTVLLWGETVDIPPSALNPDFSQDWFDRTYSCTEDLRSVVPPN
ncbi:MAG: hypothetical protein AB2A00_21040 [Myxococcota bacterium]